MPPVLCPLLLLRRCVLPRCLQPGRRLAHSEPPHPQSVSPVELVIGILVISSSILASPAYVLSNLSQFRRR